MMQHSVAILGAGGRLGMACVQAFHAAGWRVYAYSRRPVLGLPIGVKPVVGPLDQVSVLAAAMPGTSVVVHAINPALHRWSQEVLPSADAALSLARKLDALFMLPGNLFNFGQGMPSWLDETTPFEPTTQNGQVRCALEALVQHYTMHEVRPLDALVLRAGDFFGAGRGSWFDEVVTKSMTKGRLSYPGPLGALHSWAYLPDLARAFVALAERHHTRRIDPQRTRFESFGFAGHAVSGLDFMLALEGAAADLQLRPKAGFRYVRTPWTLLRLAGLLSPRLLEVSRLRFMWERPHAIDGAALHTAIGPQRPTPLRQALRDSLLATISAARPEPPRALAQSPWGLKAGS